MAQEVAAVSGIEIRAVGDEGDGVLPAVGLDLLPSHIQQGADPPAQERTDPAEPPHPAAPGQMEQKGFHIVARGVGRGDPVVAFAGAKFVEKGIADPATGFLQPFPPGSGLGSHIRPHDVKGHAPAGAPFPRKGLVPLGLVPAQAVVHVGSGQPPAMGGGQRPHSVEQGHGISPARQGDQHGGAVRDQPLPPHGGGHGIQQRHGKNASLRVEI